jgi:hypothetical protein
MHGKGTFFDSRLDNARQYPVAAKAKPEARQSGLDHRQAARSVPPIFTEPGYNLHKGEEIGIDNFQAIADPNGAT